MADFRGEWFSNTDATTRVEFDEGPLAGQWIEIREELTAGEEEEFAARMASMAGDDGGLRADQDLASFRLGVIVTFLVRWSLKDADGEKLPCKRRVEPAVRGLSPARRKAQADRSPDVVDVLRAMRPAVFDQLWEAVSGSFDAMVHGDEEVDDESDDEREFVGREVGVGADPTLVAPAGAV